MKKTACTAIFLLLLSACYTPLNNSGVATTKSWVEIPAVRSDFDGKQYDSCVRFNVRFWPQEAAQRIDLQQACISSCCWRSERSEVVLDFNKNFEQELHQYGRARKYSPGKLTFRVSHANWINTTKVVVSPKQNITRNGLIKLTYKEVQDPARLAQLARKQTTAPAPQPTLPARSPLAVRTPQQTDEPERLLREQAGTKIDRFFYQMDKTYKKQGAVFLLSNRFFTQVAANATTHQYTLLCQARARTGLTEQTLRASTFSCGTWAVNTAGRTVAPVDKRAQLIWDF